MNQINSASSQRSSRTALEVNRALAALGLPVLQAESLLALSQWTGRDRFLEKLDSAQSGGTESVRAIFGLVWLLSPKTLASMRTHLPELAVSSLINLYQEAQPKIEPAMCALATPDRHQAAVAHLARMLGATHDSPVPSPSEDYTASQDVSDDVQTDAPANREFGKSCHIYGQKFVLCFSETQRKNGKCTLSVDAAAVLEQRNAGRGIPRNYDWANKITIQLTEVELTRLLWVLRGIHTGCKFSAHGKNNDKGLEVKCQEGGWYVSMTAPGTSRGVPVPAEFGVEIAYLVIDQIKRNTGFDAATLLALNESFGRIAKPVTVRQ